MDDLTVERFMPAPSSHRDESFHQLSTGLEFEKRRRILLGKEIPEDGTEVGAGFGDGYPQDVQSPHPKTAPE
jgi:hypothetical protein